MKILITGANGFLGQHLSLFLSGKGFEVHAFSRGHCRIPGITDINYYDIELTDVRALADLIAVIGPDVIVHTAALSKPDECDREKDACLLNNVTVTESLVHLAKAVNAHFIYTSTDFIFGENGPHAEEDVPDPLNFYGKSKLMAEELVIASGACHTIVRPVFIYGPCWDGMRPSFLHWVKDHLLQGKQIKIVTDQSRTPTYVNDLCKGIACIIEQKREGTYHLAGPDIVSPYEMAVTVAQILKFDAGLIVPVTAATFPEPVKRARRSGLRIDKAKRELGYEPIGFEEGVRLTFPG